MAQIGAHVSVAGGLVSGLMRAEELGITIIQIFGSSPRQWLVRTPSAEDTSAYFQKQAQRPVEPVFLHAPYLINLSAENNGLRMKSIEAMIGHLSIAEKIKAAGLVFHVGSSSGSKERALQRIVEGMLRVLEAVSGPSLILENSTGGGNKIGTSPAELGFIFRSVGSDRVGVCLDTAHAFQSGMLNPKLDRINRYLEDWDDKLGLGNIVLVHANDSLTEFNSGRDRHANIGDGFIGLDGFKVLAESPLGELPWMLEVPGLDNQGPDRENVERLRSIFACIS